MKLIEVALKELKLASAIKPPAERSIAIAAVVAKALRSIGRDPVLVGGAAVEFYTQGGYSTSDIDMVCEGGKDLVDLMSRLGFEKIGKDFIHRQLSIYIEFPSSRLKPSEQFDSILVPQGRLRVISLEDLIVDRLCAFKFWRSLIDGINALLLLESREYDESRLKTRAKQEEVEDALEGILQLEQEVIRKKLSPSQANLNLSRLIKALEAASTS